MLILSNGKIPEAKNLFFLYRNPDPQLRPTFETVFRMQRRPEELLLHWSEEDVAAGRHLLQATHTTHSFSDLQNKYTAQ